MTTAWDEVTTAWEKSRSPPGSEADRVDRVRLPSGQVSYFRAGWQQGELAGAVLPAADAFAFEAG